jgi:hypothetical protein
VQLRGGDDKNNYSRCEGAKLVGEIFDNFTISNITNIWGYNLSVNSISSPCGLQAKSFFNGKK